VVTGFLKAHGESSTRGGTKPDETAAIVAKEVGVTPEVAKHDMGDYDFISLQDQLGENWLGSAGKPGRVADVLKRTADFLVEQKSIRSAPCRRGVPGGYQHHLHRAGAQGLIGVR
jgi:taurine transport system substrate-binding protein